jgi:hypothetical protein
MVSPACTTASAERSWDEVATLIVRGPVEADGDGLGDFDGLVDGLGETLLGDGLGDFEPDGDALGDLDGLVDGLGDLDGLVDGLGDFDGDFDGVGDGLGTGPKHGAPLTRQLLGLPEPSVTLLKNWACPGVIVWFLCLFLKTKCRLPTRVMNAFFTRRTVVPAGRSNSTRQPVTVVVPTLLTVNSTSQPGPRASWTS